MSAMDKVNNILGKLPFVKLAGNIPEGIRGKIPFLNVIIPFANHIASGAAIVVLVACFGGGGGVGTASSPGDFTYELTEDGAGVRITSYTSDATKVSVPAAIEGIPVTEIADSVFAGEGDWASWDEDRNIVVITERTNKNNFITSITIPATVKKIDGGCFANTSITSFNMPDSVTEIGVGLFNGCALLTELRLSDNLTRIDYELCNDARSLKKVNLPKNLKELAQASFSGCINLTELIIPSTLKSVRFIYIDWIRLPGKEITIKDDYGNSAFFACGKLPLKTRSIIQGWGYTGPF